MKTLISITASALTMAVFYLLFSFFLWDFNPENWGVAGRIIFVWLGGAASVACYAFVYPSIKIKTP